MSSMTVNTPAPAGPVPAHETEGRRLSHVMAAVLIGYVGVILVLMFKDGALMTPDLFVVLALVVAVVLGRTRMFLRDWLPFAAIFLGWESMRGLADNLGATVHSNDVIAVERFFFFGRVPSEVLQAAFHKAGHVNLLDIGTTFLYAAHFAFPLVVAFIFWTLERRLFYRYLLALLLMSFAAFFCYLLIPVAPPRFAGSYGQALAVEDIAQSTFSQLHFSQVTTWLYGAMPGNQVAAFPSLHAAYPLLAYLFARTRWPRASLIALAWSVAMWFSVVYLGHHYVIDVVAGILFAIGAYAALQSSTLKRFAAWLGGIGRRKDPSALMTRDGFASAEPGSAGGPERPLP
jgi:membrane-associated phospholipid phosphatase